MILLRKCLNNHLYRASRLFRSAFQDGSSAIVELPPFQPTLLQYRYRQTVPGRNEVKREPLGAKVSGRIVPYPESGKAGGSGMLERRLPDGGLGTQWLSANASYLLLKLENPV
jgi:hypothetical protein